MNRRDALIRVIDALHAEIEALKTNDCAALERAEPVIRRGDPVLIEAGSPGFSISREGVAVGDAPPGGRVMIKVDGSNTPVQAVAVEAGRATLPGWTD